MTCAGTAWAFEQNTKDATAKLVLIAISEGACGDDETYMIDLRQVADLAMIDESTVPVYLNSLERLGFITALNSGKETLYRLNGVQS